MSSLDVATAAAATAVDTAVSAPYVKIDKEAVRTFTEGFLGAVTFNAYKYFIVTAPMKELIKEQKAALDAQNKLIQEMRQKLDKHNIS